MPVHRITSAGDVEDVDAFERQIAALEQTGEEIIGWETFRAAPVSHWVVVTRPAPRGGKVERRTRSEQR